MAITPFKVIQGHSRSPILVPIESPYTLPISLLLVINSNLPSMFQRFQVTADYMQNFRQR